MSLKLDSDLVWNSLATVLHVPEEGGLREAKTNVMQND